MNPPNLSDSNNGPGELPLASSRSGAPRAVQHAQARIIQLIHEDGLVPGAMLPGYQELARRCDVATATVQRAIAELAKQGIVRSESRRGTFLARTVDPAIDGVALMASGHLTSNAATAKLAKILTVGVVAFIPADDPEYLEQNWAHAIVDGVERAAAFEPLVTVRFINLWRRDEPPLTADYALQILAEANADGQIVIPHSITLPGDQFPAASTVLVTDDGQARPVSQVYYDSKVAGYQAASHLMEFGYRRILFASPFDGDWVRERLEGVRQAVSDSRNKASLEIFIGDMAMAGCDQTRDAHQMAVSGALKDVRGVAIVACNDAVAYGIAQAMTESGLEYGRDFGLMGFDDRPLSREMGITSLRPPLEEMGREALRLLLQSLRTQSVAGHLRLASSLARRASTRAAGN